MWAEIWACISVYGSICCMWLLYGLCWLSNLVCVISACWRYSCSPSISSSLPHSELSVMPLLSPSTLRSNKKDGSVGVDCCFTLLLSWQAGEEESKGRRRRRRTEGERDGVWEREEREQGRERVGGKGCFVSTAAWVTERMENRTECTLCAFVCIHVCVLAYSICGSACACTCTGSWVRLRDCTWRTAMKRFVLIVRWR